MKYITTITRPQFSIEVYECECGYHIGIDSTFLEQVGDIKTKCPSCKKNEVVKGDND